MYCISGLLPSILSTTLYVEGLRPRPAEILEARMNTTVVVGAKAVTVATSNEMIVVC